MNDLDRHIGSRIRGRRKLLRRSIGSVAFLSGIDDDTLLAFETGQLRVPAADMIRLCEILAMRPLDMFRGYPQAEDRIPVKRASHIRILPDPTERPPT